MDIEEVFKVCGNDYKDSERPFGYFSPWHFEQGCPCDYFGSDILSRRHYWGPKFSVFKCTYFVSEI